MNELENVGSWLKETLRRMHVSQYEVMKTARMGSSTLRRCLNGKTCTSVNL